ncbi:MAG: hypothetical protein MJA29_02350 [Candidatus Omnitrophica bacterium]|nr:hypothetical protein [Candidatus Omnitrophota bacterium]
MEKIIRIQPRIITSCQECIYSMLVFSGFLRLKSQRVCSAHLLKENNKPVDVSEYENSIPEWCSLEEYEAAEHQLQATGLRPDNASRGEQISGIATDGGEPLPPCA